MSATTLSFDILGEKITPERVSTAIKNASHVNWGKHNLKWRYHDVVHRGITYKKGDFVPTDQWHLLKRIYVDKDWGVNTTIEAISKAAKKVILAKSSQIWVYGYYRTSPPRLQWAFYSPKTRIVVIYDDKADLIVTVFKSEVASDFFSIQFEPQKINRKKWSI